MDEEFVAVTVSVINAQIDNVTKTISSELKEVWVKNFASFKRYLKDSYVRNSKTKTLLYKDRPVNFNNIYVDAMLESNSESYTEAELIKELISGKKVVISATAGAGKSFFSKSVFLKLLGSKKKIPFLVELRRLNEHDCSIIELIAQDLRKSKFSVSDNQLLDLLRSGKFVLLLDGYDELAASKISSVDGEIQKLVEILPETAMMITTRPDDKIEYLAHFETYRVCPLGLDQAVSLIEKLDYDEVVKKSFTSKLSSGLFKKHNDFLSNPLLLTIMVMTYSEVAEIPSKMHIFYEQAFDVLFYKHDSSKGMYKRENKSGLAIDDFRDILACVSASSYIREQVSLTTTDLLNYIRKAKRTANVTDLNPDAFKDDLLKTVCILVQDGNKYAFTHRSFQEYFAALFLVQFPLSNSLAVYSKFLARGKSDSALRTAFALNQNRVENEFILPELDRLIGEQLEPIDAFVRWAPVFKLRWSNAGKNGKPTYSLTTSSLEWEFQVFLEKVYEKEARKLIKFGVLTKKAYLELYAKTETTVFDFRKGVNPSDKAVLEKLGILEIAKKRLEFLRSMQKQIRDRHIRLDAASIEDWM
jgi:hypothetical protein